MQTSTKEPTTTFAKEQASEADGPSVNASAPIGGIEESQLQPPNMASQATNGSVAGVSVAPVPSATVGSPAGGTSAAPLPPMQDPEVINAINVLKRYPDLAMMSSVGGGINGFGMGPTATPAVMPVPSSDGAVQQQQQQQQQQQLLPSQQQHELPPQQQQHQYQLSSQHQQLLLPQQQYQQMPPQQQQQQQQQQQPQMPYGGGSPAMRPMQYTQLGSALPASQQPSPYQQQRSVMPGYYGGEVVSESHSPHIGGAAVMASCGPAMHPAPFYCDPRHYYATGNDGMMAMQSTPPMPLLPTAAVTPTASYLSRQSSTMVTDAGGYHHTDQVAMFRDRPLRPGTDNYCYMSRRRSTYPSPYPLVYGVTEMVENVKYRYPDHIMCANPHGMYGNGMDAEHAGPAPYRHLPNGAGGYNNGGGGMVPALEWNAMYVPVAGGMNGNGASAASTSEHQPADMQSPMLPSADPRPRTVLSAVGCVGRSPAAASAATPAPGGQPAQHAAAVGEQMPGAAATVSGDVSGAGLAASVSASSAASPAGPAGGMEKSDKESSQDAASGCAAAVDSVDICTDEVSTSADNVLPAPPRKRIPPPFFETPRKRLAVAASATEEARCDSATQAAESLSSVASSANGRSDSKAVGKKASKHVTKSVAAETVHVVCQPLETAALRPRKSCMGSMDGGRPRTSTVNGDADDIKTVAFATPEPNDARKKASTAWDVGAIVWARLSGERWWPAMTIEGHQALQKPAEGTCCWVFWYGDHKVSEIASEKIQWFASNFTQRFSSSGGKVYKKAVAEALLECIRRSGYPESDQTPIAEENEHLRSCARKLFEQKGVSNIDQTPGTVTPLVADFLRVIVSRIPAANSPSASDGGASSSSSKKASVAAEEDSDDEDASTSSKAKAAVSGKLSSAASPSPSLSSNGSKTTVGSETKASTPGSKSSASASKNPSSSAAKPTAQGSAKKVARDASRSSGSRTAAPVSPTASSSSSCSSSSSNGLVSSSTGCPTSDEVKAGQGVSRQQYRAAHGKKLDDFFNEVRKGKRMLNEVCIACNVHRKPVVVKHPLIEGGLCDTCKGNIMEALFSYGTDGCNVYCVLCGDGGDVLVCEQSGCGKTYCQGCIETLGSPALLKQCLEASPWSCFICSDEPIVTTNRKSLIVRRPDWQVHVSKLFEKPGSNLHRGPSAKDLEIKKKLRVLSLFDGIATGKLVLDALGFDIEVYYASEIDPDSILVTKINHGDSVIQLGDVRELSVEKLMSLGPIDLLIGGSPCNDLALVNPARKGLYDGTGVLFFDFYRILQILTHLHPNNTLFWLFENVVCMRVETKNTICRFLECEPVNFNAGLLSAQNRARYFWGNIPGLYTPLNPDILEQNITLQSVLTPGFDRKANVHKLRTVTTRTASLKQGHKEEVFPVTMNGSEGRLWPTELERVFGMPDHYTDVGVMGPTKRQKLLGRAWCVPVVKHLLTPLKQFFRLKEVKENAAEAARQ